MGCNEICTVHTSDGALNNSYTFFEDGTVIHSYGKHTLEHDSGDLINVKDLTTKRRKDILKKCPAEHKGRLRVLFEKYETR